MTARRDIRLAEPPRGVPLSARLAVTFGGVVQQMGWAFLGFGMIFVVIFLLNSEALTLIQFRGATETTEGVVQLVRQTSASENNSTIYGVRFRYEVEGVGYEGESYTLDGRMSSGQPVPVEYLQARPGRARIEGMRARMFGAGVAFVVIFPVVGFIMALIGFVRGVRRQRLLRDGKLAFGKLVSRKATATRVNKQTVYKLTFEFRVPKPPAFGYRQSADEEGEVHQASYRTHLTASLEDEAEEPLLYDPKRPSNAYPVDAMPAGVSLALSGQIETTATGMKYLLLPAIGLAAPVIATLLAW